MRDYSYGIIPLHLKRDQWELLLVQHQAGHWAFPKGHAENNETAQEAAARELQEETGLTVSSFLTTQPLLENYFFVYQGKRIFKTVYYFLATVEGTLKIQESEIDQAHWFSIDEASNRMTFAEGKKLCIQVKQILGL